MEDVCKLMSRHTGTGTRVIVDLPLAFEALQHHNEPVASHQASYSQMSAQGQNSSSQVFSPPPFTYSEMSSEDKNLSGQAVACMPQLWVGYKAYTQFLKCTKTPDLESHSAFQFSLSTP